MTRLESETSARRDVLTRVRASGERDDPVGSGARRFNNSSHHQTFSEHRFSCYLAARVTPAFSETIENRTAFKALFVPLSLFFRGERATGNGNLRLRRGESAVLRASRVRASRAPQTARQIRSGRRAELIGGQTSNGPIRREQWRPVRAADPVCVG